MNYSLPALAGLRGLAALWVLLYHAWVYATPREILLPLPGIDVRVHVLFSLGWAGVQVLFVLSAFLLTLPWARAAAGLADRPAPLSYYVRRVARVFPAYYTQLLVLVALGWVLNKVVIVQRDELPRYLLMLFVPPPVGIGAPDSVNGVWWTLPIELSFYLVLPLLAPLLRWERRWYLLAACLLLSVVWRWWTIGVLGVQQSMHVWAYQLPGSLDSFGLGMFGALLHVQHVEQGLDAARFRSLLRRLLWAVPVAFVCMAAWLDARFEHYWEPGLLLFSWTAMFSALVLVVVLNGASGQRALLWLLANRWVYYLGLVSYGLYLWHPPIGSWIMASDFWNGISGYRFVPLALMMFAGALLLASLSWYLVEKPAMRVLRRQ